MAENKHKWFDAVFGSLENVIQENDQMFAIVIHENGTNSLVSKNFFPAKSNMLAENYTTCADVVAYTLSEMIKEAISRLPVVSDKQFHEMVLHLLKQYM